MNARKILTLMAANALEESGQLELAALVRAAQIDDYDYSGVTSSFKLMTSIRGVGEKRVSQNFARFTPDIVRRFGKIERLSLIFELPLEVTATQEIVTVLNASLPDWLKEKA